MNHDDRNAELCEFGKHNKKQNWSKSVFEPFLNMSIKFEPNHQI